MMMRAQGPGHIAFSADRPGETLAVPLRPGQAIDVVEHRFLVATGNVGYDWQNSSVWFTTQGRRRRRSGTTRSARPWTASRRPGSNGLLLLHAPGNTFIRDLAAGRADPGAAGRADLEGPVGRGCSCTSSTRSGAVLVQLGPLAGQVGLADPAGAGPGGRAVGVRAARDGRERAAAPPVRRPSTGNCFRCVTTAQPSVSAGFGPFCPA